MAVLADLYESAPMIPETTTPSENPPTGFKKIYTKSDEKIYVLNDAGTETAAGGIPHDPGDDAGAVTLADFTVTSSPAAGTEQSYALQIDNNDQLEVYTEADGAGGLQNQRLHVLPSQVRIGGTGTGSNEAQILVGTRAIAIGTGGVAITNDGTSLGHGTSVGGSGVTIGRSAATGGGQAPTGAIAIGRQATVNANADDSIAIGRTATVNSSVTNAVALGASATADKNNMVALRTGNFFEWPDDDGAVTLVDMDVTSTPAGGTEESIVIQVDGTDFIKAYTEADGSGGIQNSQVRINQALANSSGTQLLATSPSSAYSPSNVTTDRTYDANSTTTAELADVLGTLISDLQTHGLIG